jgi:hypothetical protein
MPDLDLLSPVERETWANGEILVLDYEAKGVRFMPEDQVYGDQFVTPAGLVLDIPSFWKFTRKRMDNCAYSDEALDWYVRMGDALREARCASVVLERATPEEALEAFRHIAKTGVPMSEEDFTAAMSWALENEGRILAP